MLLPASKPMRRVVIMIVVIMIVAVQFIATSDCDSSDGCLAGYSNALKYSSIELNIAVHLTYTVRDITKTSFNIDPQIREQYPYPNDDK
jgi:hypothetical protein